MLATTKKVLSIGFDNSFWKYLLVLAVGGCIYSVNSKTLFFAILYFGLISSSNASELDNFAACSGVAIGNASVDFSLGDEGSFNDGIKLAITDYLSEVLEQSSAEEDIAIADQILAANTDKIINAANTETFDYVAYEQVVQCFQKIGVFYLITQKQFYKIKNK